MKYFCLFLSLVFVLFLTTHLMELSAVGRMEVQQMELPDVGRMDVQQH